MIMTRAAAVLVGSFMLASVMAVAPGRADFDILNGEIVTTTQTLGDNETGIVEEGGEIDINGGGGGADAIEAGDYNTIINHGLISLASSFGDAITVGNYNIIFNDGIISVSSSEPLAALWVGESNTITNTGTIEIGGSDKSLIYLDHASNTIINSGTMTAEGSSTIFLAVSGGAHKIINSGLLKAGTIFTGHGNNTIINSGLMEAAGNVILFDEGDNTITNTGTMHTTSDNIAVQLLTTNLTNSGTIQSDQGIAIMNVLGSGLSVITNSGSIISDHGYSIVFGDSMQVNLLAGSIIVGPFAILQGDDTIFDIGNGLSVLLLFENNVLPNQLETNGMPSVTTASQIATVDTTGFAMANTVAADLAGNVLAVWENHLDEIAYGGAQSSEAALSSNIGVHADGRSSTGDYSFWQAAYGSKREQEASEPMWSSTYEVAGGVIGMDIVNWSGIRAGYLVGASISRLEVDDSAQTISTDAVHAAVYGSYGKVLLGRHVFVDVAVLGSYLFNDSTRRINNNAISGGLQDATADYDSWFVTPEVRVGVRNYAAWGITQPSLSLRYLYQSIDDYEEQGSDADLTVEARTVQGIIAKAEVKFSAEKQSEQGDVIFGSRMGLEYDFAFGDDDVSAVLLNEDIVFDPNGKNDALGFFADWSTGFRPASSAATFCIDGGFKYYFNDSIVYSVRLSADWSF